MARVVNQQASGKAESLREVMPRLAQWIDERRAEFGAPFVNDCIRRSMGGEPDLFYAIEEGRVLGTPFRATLDPGLVQWQSLAVVAGVKFAAFLARPKHQQGAIDGEN